MNRKVFHINIWLVLVVIILAGSGLWWYNYKRITIESIVLTSPHNYAFQEEIEVDLNKSASVFIRYWKEGSPEIFRTNKTSKLESHTVHLLLLETDVTYKYQIVIEGIIDISSKVFSFHTREQSPWLENNWIKDDKPHDASALGDGLILLCGSHVPGYVAMVDGEGKIRWYWQVDDIGVRVATFTPNGTILAMLRPPKKDVIDDASDKQKDILRKMKQPMRRGKMGYAGGTALAEIDLTGKVLWRMDLDKYKNNEYKIIHHDIQMDDNHRIHTLIRTSKIIDKAFNGSSGQDTLIGDGILLLDTTGKEILNWSVWDVWDVKNDPHIEEFAYDRFHMNALSFDTDSNYLVSVSIEDQIWKIDARTGALMWRLGKGGDFKMDTSSYFSFQHNVHINSEGDLMLFDNGIYKNESRTLSFDLDTVSMVATTRINAPLPKSLYSSRMGSAYLLPNGNLLQTSSKKGTVLITTKTGEILWELDTPNVLYRAEYVPAKLWDKYYLKE